MIQELERLIWVRASLYDIMLEPKAKLEAIHNWNENKQVVRFILILRVLKHTDRSSYEEDN